MEMCSNAMLMESGRSLLLGNLFRSLILLQERFKVNNTDAEGRLTPDALVYVCNQGVAKIVDLATLTGPCAVALGRSIVALEVTGEKLRRMPMEVSYWESMKSGVAYMVNTGGPQGGAIAAAIFLKQFATGFGVATLVEWELNNSS